MLYHYRSFGDSPSFVRQEIKDDRGDWQLWKGSLRSFNVTTHDGKEVRISMADNLSECKVNGQFISPDIESVSYKSDGKMLDGTIWLTAPFTEPPVNDSIDSYQESVEFDQQNQNLSLGDYSLVKTSEIGILNMKIENSTLLGSPAKEVFYNETYGNERLQKFNIWTIKNNIVHDITFSALDSTFKKYYPIVKSILNSFAINDTGSSNFSANNPVVGMRTYQDSDIKFRYPSDWQAIPSQSTEGRSVIIRSPFEDSLSKEPSWHEPTFTMSLDLNSVYDTGTDYRIIYSRIPHGEWTGNWTRQVEEVSAYDKVGFVKEETNSSIIDKRTPYRIPFLFNLEDANLPDQYKIVFYVTDHYVLGHHFCRLVDTTNWVIVPPPKFTMLTSPNSVVLRPGEQSNVVVEIKGNTALQSEAILETRNSMKDLSTSFVPNRTSIPASSSGSSTLHIRVLDNASVSTPTPVILPISANITFPTSITNRGGDTFSNNKSITLPESSNFTLTILPAYTELEKFNNFVNTVITPVSGLWTFLAGVGAVIVPLIVQLYRKRQKQDQTKKDLDTEKKEDDEIK